MYSVNKSQAQSISQWICDLHKRKKKQRKNVKNYEIMETIFLNFLCVCAGRKFLHACCAIFYPNDLGSMHLSYIYIYRERERERERDLP